MELKKYTFIDEIKRKNKKDPVPGPGKYNVVKT